MMPTTAVCCRCPICFIRCPFIALLRRCLDTTMRSCSVSSTAHHVPRKCHQCVSEGRYPGYSPGSITTACFPERQQSGGLRRQPISQVSPQKSSNIHAIYYQLTRLMFRSLFIGMHLDPSQQRQCVEVALSQT